MELEELRVFKCNYVHNIGGLEESAGCQVDDRGL